MYLCLSNYLLHFKIYLKRLNFSSVHFSRVQYLLGFIHHSFNLNVNRNRLLQLRTLLCHLGNLALHLHWDYCGRLPRFPIGKIL